MNAQTEIIQRLVDDVLAAGYSVSVLQHLTPIVQWERDAARIVPFVTRGTHIEIYRNSVVRIGTVVLDFDADWDIIKVFTPTALMEHLMKGALNLADEERLA